MNTTRIAASVVLAFACGAVDAAAVEVTETLDLSYVPQNVISFAFSGAPYFAPPPTFSMAAGDTLSLTIDFKGGQFLHLWSPQDIWAYVTSEGPPSNVQQTGTLSFLDRDGNVIATSAQRTDIDGFTQVGQWFRPESLAALPPEMEVFGLRYDGHLDAYLDPGVTTRDYTTPNLWVVAQRLEVGVVPEPPVAALGLAGLLALGAWKKRAKRGA